MSYEPMLLQKKFFFPTDSNFALTELAYSANRTMVPQQSMQAILIT
jgi:hypothetical protein